MRTALRLVKITRSTSKQLVYQTRQLEDRECAVAQIRTTNSEQQYQRCKCVDSTNLTAASVHQVYEQ